MIIGIDASRAFIKQRTGIEEYSYQVIKYLREELKNEKVFLYIRKNQKVEFALPESWEIKAIKFPYLWTQIGLSLEMLFRPADTLFVPGHIVPIIHPVNTIATVHGLEYEFYPEAYSFWERLYMRWSIKKSCRWAKKIIAVSENTKRDLVNLYKVPEEKIETIYEGVGDNFQFSIFNFQSISNDKIFNDKIKTPYLLFIGRLEERKNIVGIIKSFEILKEKYKISHKLVLAGGRGYNYENIKSTINSSRFNDEIIELGFVSEKEKWELLKNADVFLFPTFYEGFGLPILEAQSVGTPVVAGDNSSIPEISGVETHCNASLQMVDPNNPSEIAEATYKLISDKALRDDIIEKGYENVKRFSWEKCAEEIRDVILNEMREQSD